MASADYAPQARPLDPNLQFGDRRGGERYPNVFFDLAQQYMPPTIKELFRWCTFYYYNSPLIGSAIKKISRYPITDLIFDDPQESVRSLWSKVFNKEFKIKERMMEVNLDYHVYGNAFVSLHLPFTRFLQCMDEQCKHKAPITQWKWGFNSASYSFTGHCEKCGTNGNVRVLDIPYKDRKAIRLIRWNPENIYVKYNEYTGRRIYMYSVPYKLKTAIQRADKDILEDIPMIVIEALAKRRMIRFNNDNFMHLRSPTLAEQDQGWGKPHIIHVLKDMYYLYTLRRAQESIALEHIVPFDIIYPMPNAQQDPYIHTDLGNWKSRIEDIIRKHRRDPNFKGVIPIPVGFGRLGGDGKAMLLAPELSYLNQTIVGGMGIPQEFLFGGLNYTGSSISLRTLENDFIQNRSQLLDLVIWIKDKTRIWLSLPDIKEIRFADFRMADDVQRNQQLIGLNAQMKLSDQTMLTELGYNYEQEQQKMLEEAYLMNYLNDLRAKGAAKTQGEASLISFNYQQKVNQLMQKAQANAVAMGGNIQNGMEQPGQEQDPNAGGGAGGNWQGALPQPGGDGAPPGGAQPNPAEAADQELQKRVSSWAGKLQQMGPTNAQLTLADLKAKMPDIGRAVEQEYNLLKMEGSGGGKQMSRKNNVNMLPMPTQKPPRRAGSV